jgi:uncharacterized protein YpuA (DUF1002 family)
MKETSKGNSGAESYDFKKFFVDMIDSIKEQNKALRDSIMSMKTELLDRYGAETGKCTQLISQVQEETEAGLIMVNSKLIVIEVSEELENNLEINSTKTNSILTELTNKMIVKDAKTEDKLERLDSKIDKF